MPCINFMMLQLCSISQSAQRHRNAWVLSSLEGLHFTGARAHFLTSGPFGAGRRPRNRENSSKILSMAWVAMVEDALAKDTGLWPREAVMLATSAAQCQQEALEKKHAQFNVEWMDSPTVAAKPLPAVCLIPAERLEPETRPEKPKRSP